jgi:hypothetical protein
MGKRRDSLVIDALLLIAALALFAMSAPAFTN